MSFHIDGTQGVQYNDVSLGNLLEVSSAIISRQSLIVRDSAEGSVLDVANIFDSIGESFSTLFGTSDQKERVIAALNSFYPQRKEELCMLSPYLIQQLISGLQQMQEDMTLSPSSHGPTGEPMIRDLSQSRHAGQDARQRVIPAASCLSNAIDAVQDLLTQIETNHRSFEDTPPNSLEEGFLLIENPEEDVARLEPALLDPEEDLTASEDESSLPMEPDLFRILTNLRNESSSAPALNVPENLF
jgi:hypothetical protein